MKKKIGLSVVIIFMLLDIVTVYGIGGSVAPWVWNMNIFIVAPLACILLIGEIVTIVVRLLKHKKIVWNIAYAALTLIAAYPFTILFGASILTYPKHESETQAITIQDPIEDGILKGGKDYKSHAVWPSECYAYDIVKEPYETGSKELSDYGIYLADVTCPVDGTVIELESSEDDIEPNIDEFKSLLGNYIFIRIDKTDTYLILAHLEKNSISVKTGDHVTQGMVIAKVGNSGTTSEPHLHIQHQKNDPTKIKFLICSEGLPIVFED